jgi:hypothetical protein
MYRKLAFFSLIAVLPLGALAQVKPVTSRGAAAKANISALQKKLRTPADRLLLPYLKTRIAASSGKTTVRPESAQTASSVVATAPNFGGFLTAPYYPAHLQASCVADPFNCGVSVSLGADFDKDGKPDIAVLQSDGTLNVLLNNGSGGLASPVSYLNPNYSSSFIAQGFAVDINSDGYTDIVELDSNNNALITYLNQKDGTFGTAQTTALSQTYGYVSSMAIGDVNGDGSLDVVTISANQTAQNSTTIAVQTYLGTGTGSLTVPTSALTQTAVIAAQVQIPQEDGITLGDLNKDGHLDIALDLEEQTSQTAGNVVATIALGSGSGNGSFAPININIPVSIPVTATGGLPFLIFNSAGVQITDLNNDTSNDLAIDSSGILYVALGNGSGGFSATTQDSTIGSSNQILYADVTGDGIPDLIQGSGTVNIWVGQGNGTFSIPVNGNMYIGDSGGSQSLLLADYTGDGNTDIAQLGQDYKQVSILAGNGKGVFQGALNLNSTTDATSYPLFLNLEAAGDVLGTGYTDPIFIDDNGAAPYVVSALSDGKGKFTYKTALAASAVSTIGYIQPLTADFNGDGKQDILIAGTDGSLTVSLSNGDGTFKTPVSMALPSLNCEVDYAATGDLNGDGYIDAVVAYPGDASCGGTGSNASGYFVALGKGDGTFATPVFTAAGNELYSVAIADFNLDGNPDLILNDEPFDGSGSFAIDLLTGNGDGSFSAGSSVYSNFLVSTVVAADYNQDGKPDLILFTEGESSDTNPLDTAGIVLIPGNGDGTFNGSNEIAIGNFFLNGVLTDVNNDGVPDLVAALYRTPGQPNTYYGLSTLLGIGQGEFSAPVNSLESLASSLPLPGNFLADNAIDFVVETGYGPGLFLGQGGTAISLTTSAASVSYGQAETITAALSPTVTSRPAPTGSVSFYDGTTLLATVAVTNSSAVYTANVLAVGTHSITAVYSGDTNFNPNTSSMASVTVVTLPPAFTLVATPGSVRVTVGQQTLASLTLTGNATFSGSISLTCSGLPTNASCAVNPAQVTLAGLSTTQATLVIGTTTSSANNAPPPSRLAKLAGGVSLAGLFLCFSRRRFRRAAPWIFSMLLLTTATTTLTGCGSGSSVRTAAKGSYTVTITAAPSGSTAAAQTATIAVTLQ